MLCSTYGCIQNPRCLTLTVYKARSYMNTYEKQQLIMSSSKTRAGCNTTMPNNTGTKLRMGLITGDRSLNTSWDEPEFGIRYSPLPILMRHHRSAWDAFCIANFIVVAERLAAVATCPNAVATLTRHVLYFVFLLIIRRTTVLRFFTDLRPCQEYLSIYSSQSWPTPGARDDTHTQQQKNPSPFQINSTFCWFDALLSS